MSMFLPCSGQSMMYRTIVPLENKTEVKLNAMNLTRGKIAFQMTIN